MFIQLWALYDSFKRSFFCLKKNLFEDIPNPIFIISYKQNLSNIFYKNTAAGKLFEKLLYLKSDFHDLNSKIKKDDKTSLYSHQNSIFSNTDNHKKKSLNMPVKKRTIMHNEQYIQNPNMKVSHTFFNREKAIYDDVTISNLFNEKQQEDYFFHEIKTCLYKKKKYFNFPLKPYNKEIVDLKFHENSEKRILFEGDLECYDWYKIVVSPCSWKSQEAVFLQFFKDIDFKKEDFVSNFLGKTLYECNIVVENIDECCKKITETDYLLEKFEKSNRVLKNVNNTSGPLARSRNRCYITPPGISDIKKNKFKSSKHIIYNNNSNNFEKIIDNNLYLNNDYAHQIRDHSIWFFFKMNVNLIYDYFLSMNVFEEIINQKFKKFDCNVNNLKNLIKSFEDNFYIISRIKNWRINSNFEDKNAINTKSLSKKNIWENIYLVHSYTRVVIFNLYLFSLNSSFDDSSEKDINILFSFEKNCNFSEEKLLNLINNLNSNKIQSLQQPFETDSFLSISLEMDDPKPKYNFKLLNEILNNKNLLTNLSSKLELLKTIDFGLLNLVLICKLIFNTDTNFFREKRKIIDSIFTSYKNDQIYNLEKTESKKKEEDIYSQKIKIMIPIMNKEFLAKYNLNISQENLLKIKIKQPKRLINETYYLKILEKTYKMHVEPILEKLHEKKLNESNENLINNIETGLTNEYTNSQNSFYENNQKEEINEVEDEDDEGEINKDDEEEISEKKFYESNVFFPYEILF